MQNTAPQNNPPWKGLWLIALCGLPILGWLGVLDQFSSEHVDNSIASAGLIYGTARGINALVSLLQGTELDLLFLTFSIGEILDPINDLIERFSAIILIALGSLALQKILLVVVSHTMFNIVLTVLAIATALSLLSSNHKLFGVLLRSFFVIAFFRFSLGLVVLANSWVDASFLDQEDQQRHRAMESFQGELREVEALSRSKGQFEASAAAIEQQLARLEFQRAEYEASINFIEQQIQASLERLAALREKAGRLCTLSLISPTCTDAVNDEQEALEGLVEDKELAQAGLDTVAATVEEQQEALDCLSKRQRGENCTFFDRFSNVPNPAMLQQKMKSINDNLGEFADNTINLLVSLLLKTVAIPLLFFFVLLKIVRVNWERLR